MILDSGDTCHMTPENSYFKQVSLVETDKYIEFSYKHFIIAKQTVEPQIEMRDDNGKPLFLSYVTCYWHQTCEIDYFPLLR